MPEILTKRRPWSTRLDPQFRRKSLNHLSKPISEKILKKTAQHVPNQPLKSLKSSVGCKRNHCFQFSTFAATCLEKSPQLAPIRDTSATKTRRNTSQYSSKNQQQKHITKNIEFLRKGCPFWSSFLTVFVPFSTSFGPELHSITEVRPRSPKSVKINIQNPR